jgi:hypothetical protein
MYFLCLEGRIRNTLLLSSGYNQEYTSSVLSVESKNTSSVFRVESEICLQDRIRNVVPLSSVYNQEYTFSAFKVQSAIYFLCLQGTIRNVLPLSSR